MTRTEITFSALNIRPSLSRNTSARGDLSSSNKTDEDRKIEEGLSLPAIREKYGKKIFKLCTSNEFGHYASKCPKREKKYKGKFKPRRARECLYTNEEDDSDEQEISFSGDEIGFVDIQEESLDKIDLVSWVENKSDGIIDNGCLHHMTGDMNKFGKLRIMMEVLLELVIMKPITL